MKLVAKYLEKDRSGTIKLYPEEAEDMWHIYNLLLAGDLLRANTVRRVQTQSLTGSTDSQRVRLTLTTAVESVDFDVQASKLRVNGRVAEENPHVKMGAYHTIDLELHRDLSITKKEWDIIALERIQLACDITQRADISAVVMQDGLSNVCLITENMTVLRQRIEVNIPRKRMGSTSQHDRALVRFFEQTAEALMRHTNFDIVKAVIIASPGFLKDEFYSYLFQEATRKENRLLLDQKSKFLLVHCSSGHKQALQEVLQDPSVQVQLSQTKYAKEVRALEGFFQMLHTNADRAFYGYNHVRKAIDIGAVHTLLLSDNLFRSHDISTRKRYIQMVNDARSIGADVFILSSLHVSGEQLSQLTGVAALLNFPAPQIEDEIEKEEAQQRP